MRGDFAELLVEKLMVPAGLDLAILDDDARWADDTECVDLLFAGTWFLHETLKARHPKCPLLPRLIQMGDQFERMYAGSGADATKVNVADASAFFTELNTVGTLGHSLWRLKTHLDHPGLRYELKELSKVGDNPAGDKLRLRGQGFLLMAAGHLVKEGFGLEFIKRRRGRSDTGLLCHPRRKQVRVRGHEPLPGIRGLQRRGVLLANRQRGGREQVKATSGERIYPRRSYH